jgi:type I restriction enzyme M protein
LARSYGQEKNITTYNLARMNMLLHGMKDTEFEIFHGDTLLNEWDTMREQNPAKKPSFDAIVANPPFSYRWEPTDAAGRRCALQEPRPGAKVRRRLRLPAARLPLS